MSGNHLPHLIPPRVRRHSSSAQLPARRQTCFRLLVGHAPQRSGEHARGPPGWQWLLPRTGVLRTLVAAVRVGSGDRGGHRALNSRIHDTGSTPCPDRPPRTTPPTTPSPRAGAFRRPRRRPHRTPGPRTAPARPPPRRTGWATSCAGRRSVASWCRSSSSGTAPRRPVPPGPRWDSPRSPPPAGCCCGVRNVAQHSCTVNSVAPIVGDTDGVVRGRAEGVTGRAAVRRWNDRTRVLLRTFSANFAVGHSPCPRALPTPVPAGRKGARRADAPYGDRPLRRGVLPSDAHECDAS